MRKISKFLLITIWITLVYILFRLDLLTGDMDSLNQFFNNSASSKALIFIALSSLRVVALIPSAVFMILGGMLFSLPEGVIMTILSIIISQTIIYVTSKILVGSQLQENIVKKIF